MRHRSPLGGDVTDSRRYVRRDCRTYVLPEHHRRSYLERNPPEVDHHESQGHGRTGRLQDNGKRSTYQHENQDRTEAEVRPFLDKCQGLRVAAQIRDGILQGRKSHEQQGKSDDELSYALALALLGHEEDKPYRYERYRQDRDVGRESEQGNEPGRYRGPDIGSHYHPYRIGERQETGIHETYDHHGSRA